MKTQALSLPEGLKNLHSAEATIQDFSAIVNIKSHLQELWRELNGVEGVFFISSHLCPAHRSTVIKEVRLRLSENLPCKLVSTQCIEAGVNIDFPIVYRAKAPLDSLIHAEGRCNREGSSTFGEMYIFTPVNEGYPDKQYKRATDITYSLKNKLVDKFDISVIKEYYKTLYKITAPEESEKELYDAIDNLSFPNVAKQFRLIKGDMINVLVPYNSQIFNNLRLEAENKGLTASWIKRARSFSISMYRPAEESVIWDRLLPTYKIAKGQHGEQDDWFVLSDKKYYQEDVGYVK